MTNEREINLLEEALQFRARISVGRELTEEEMDVLLNRIEGKMVSLIVSEYLVEGPNHNPVEIEVLAKNYTEMMRPHLEIIVSEYLDKLSN